VQPSRIRMYLHRRRRARALKFCMSPELERFIGKRPVRRVVVETALAATGAFSADELYAKTRLRQPTVGRATIYRTLRLLCDRKHFRETVLQNGVRVFQRGDESKGILWVCDDCSFIRTFSADEILYALQGIGQTAGLNPSEITIKIHSRCEDMRKTGACRIAETTRL